MPTPISPAAAPLPSPVTRAWRHDFPLADGAPLAVHLLAFDLLAFSVGQFAPHGIDCPPAILRSVPKRQAEYFCGRLAARHALRSLRLDAAQVGTGARREPLWPEGVIGSITHTRGLAAATALRQGRHAGIGIDIERVVAAPSTMTAIVKTVLDQREADYLQTLQDRMTLATLQTLVFSAKESFFKAAFASVGNYFGFDAIAIVDIDVEERLLLFRVGRWLCDDLRPGRLVALRYALLDRDTVITHCALAPAAP